MTSMVKPTLVILFGLLAACKSSKRSEKPEHILQRETEQAAQRKRKAAEDHQRQAPKTPPRSLTGADESRWSPAVRQAFQQAYKAPLGAMNRPLVMLSQQGPTADEALLYVAKRDKVHKNKRALAALLYADLHMFHPKRLAEIAADVTQPMLRRAGIDALARLGDPKSRRLLDGIIVNTPRMKAFLKRARSRPPWQLKEKQLPVLDQVLHAKDFAAARATLLTVSLIHEHGLMAIIGTRVAKSWVVGLAVRRLVDLAAADKTTTRLKAYCQPGLSPLLRMIAAHRLYETGTAKAFLSELAAETRDPLAPVLRRILEGKDPLPKPKG